jgi:hypothetical protein
VETTSPPKTEKVIEVDFYFLNGQSSGLTIRPERGDTIVKDTDSINIRLHREDGSLLEEFDVYHANVNYTASRPRTRVLVDPKLDPVAKVVAENDERENTTRKSMQSRS